MTNPTKPKRQRKYMEMSVYNKLIDQFNELQSENKRLKAGEQFWIETTQKECSDIRKHYNDIVSKQEKENTHTSSLLSQCRHNRSVISLQRDEFKAEADKQKARKHIYQGLSIMLFVALVLASIFAAW